MKTFIAVILMLFVTGCSVNKGSVSIGSPTAVANLYSPHDSMDAENLAKTHPDLQKSCEVVGSCTYLLVRCVKLDGEPWWEVSIPGASYGDVTYGDGYGSTLDEAANSFTLHVRSNKAEAAYKQAHHVTEKTHTLEPCDANCGK